MKRNLVLSRLAGAGSGVRASPGNTVRGDHDLNPDMRPMPPLTPAAVLVPLVDRTDGMTVLLTRRTDHLHDHAGQISFPGGRLEPGDADAMAAALRESREEIGLSGEHVEVAGRLDDYETRTGFRVTPVVGLISPDFSLRLDAFEVAEVFEVPLGFILDPANHRLHSRVFENRRRQYHAIPYGDYYIWGATAGMLINLYEAIGS